MSSKQQAFFARLVLICFTLLGAGWLLHLDFSKKVSIDVLDLLPAGDRRPEMAVIRSLAAERQGRVVLLAIDAPKAGQDALTAGGRSLCAALEQSGQFSEVVALGSSEMREALARPVYERRLDLLFPEWLAVQEHHYALESSRPGSLALPPFSEWLAASTSSKLEAYLAQGEALALQELLPSDPLLLLPGLMERVSAAALPSFEGGRAGLVWAVQKESPLSEAGQAPVFAAIETGRSALQAVVPGAELRWTGVGRFAAESRRRIEAELSWVNALSLGAVVVVCVLFLSRLSRVWNLVPPIMMGLLGAWVAVTLCFDRVHALVFVIGALLGGVAVDYGVYLYLQPPLYPEENYAQKLRRLIKPLLASALTTILGFSLLLASELPLIRQLGVFVGAGLLCALGGAVLWFAQVRDFHLPARPLLSRRLPFTRWTQSLARSVGLCALLVALCGPFFLTWRDDIRELEIPAPGLRENDLSIRHLFGEWSGRTVYLTRGETPAQAREAWTRFEQWHRIQYPDTPLLSLALVVPAPSSWEALPLTLAGLEHFDAALAAALEKRGFESAAFEPFFEQWRAWLKRERPTYEALVADYYAQLSGPLGMMVSAAPGSSLFTSVAAHPHQGEPPEGLDTLSTEQLGSLNKTFSLYRKSALQLSLLGLGLLGLSVLLLYGPKRGLRVFSIPLVSCFFSFGLLGLLGQPLNLFHLLGAFLGVCLSHNYAIFTTENQLRGEGAPPSIRVSALSTAASFGALSLSRIPVVSALGVSVALIVFMALLIVETEPLLFSPASRRR